MTSDSIGFTVRLTKDMAHDLRTISAVHRRTIADELRIMIDGWLDTYRDELNRGPR